MKSDLNFKALICTALCLAGSTIGWAQEAGPGPITPEGEIQDPLAPVRLAPGRQAFGPGKSQSTEEWDFEVGADYGYVASASLKQGLGTVTEQSAEGGVLASRKITDGRPFLLGTAGRIFRCRKIYKG